VSDATPPPADGPESAPHCYRHPDRETWIRCGRCERPICPDCMVAAPVGFQCPECVRAAAATVQQARTVSGGRIHRDPVLVTKILVGLNVGLFVVQYLSNDRVTRDYAMWGFGVALNGEWYRLLTSAFLHASVTHLLFNMVALWMVGGAVESRLGRWRYLTVYLVSALAGSVLSYAVDSANQVSVGASGAVFGLFGAFAVLAYRLRFDIAGIIGIILINAVIGFIPAFNINWRAHLGGLVAGTVLTAAMVYAPQKSRTAATVVAAALIVALCVGATVWRTDLIRACAANDKPIEQCSVILP
jgi:membrane associated rhomboid family serine protease